MYKKIKHFVFTTLYMLLLARFVILIGDPPPGDAAPAGYLLTPLYEGWRGFIDSLYMVTHYVNLPVETLYNLAAQLVPNIRTDWFPVMSAEVLGNYLAESLEKMPNANTTQVKPALTFLQTIPGVFDWLTLVTMFALSLLNPALDSIVDFFKNFVWNILIEFSFTKKKQALYQEALEKRAADMMKLNVEYRNLSKEASMLKETVITDDLTKVFNKRFFIEKIREEFNRAKNEKLVLSVIMMDIDHFKKLNDTYGHLMGDKVLFQVAQVAKLATPKGCFCCRFGGEEFSVIMPGKTFEEAMEVANTIRAKVPTLRFEEDPKLKVTISQGLANLDFKSPVAQGLQNFEAMLKLADDELYRAKLEGRDRVCAKKVD